MKAEGSFFDEFRGGLPAEERPSGQFLRWQQLSCFSLIKYSSTYGPRWRTKFWITVKFDSAKITWPNWQVYLAKETGWLQSVTVKRTTCSSVLSIEKETLPWTILSSILQWGGEQGEGVNIFNVFPPEKSRKRTISTIDLSKQILSGENRCNQYAAGS